MRMTESIHIANQQLQRKETSSLALAQSALGRLSDPAGEGSRTFTHVYASQALSAAKEADARRKSGAQCSPIDGLPISIKDLFDVAGEVTTAGSSVLQTQPPAPADAEVVARLKGAGAVIVGKTNMSEFAFTGVGMNPHFGTPANPYDRSRRRIPGGSSSGAPVSVADGIAMAAIGTDTGGSVRIPAALCGLVGFKPTQRRIPRDGVFPLSPTLDSVGPIARTVSCCAAVDAVLAGERYQPKPVELRSLSLAIPRNYFLDDLQAEIGRAFESAVRKLSMAGAHVNDMVMPEVEQIAEVNSRGGISAPEAYAFHRRLEADFSQYDPLVRERILRGKEISAADYLDMLNTRELLIRNFNASRSDWMFLLCPTVPIVAPEIAVLEQSPELYRRTNRLLLRNPSVVNFLDGCALTIPCHEPGSAPVGLMLIGRAMEDLRLLNAGLAVEDVLARDSN